MRQILPTLLLLAIWVVSCAPLSKEVMRQADEHLSYPVVRKDPDSYRGKTILWGGVIIETINRKDETLIKVRETELDYEKRPTNVDRSAGRFLVRSPEFLDPAIYKEGREITVAGEIAGTKFLPLGEIQYPYPFILAKEIHLWEKAREYRRVDPPFWDYPFWWHRHPFWGYPPYWW